MEDLNEFLKKWELPAEIAKAKENLEHLSFEELKSLLQKMKQHNKAFGEALKEREREQKEARNE